MKTDLRGRVVVLTGASRGIGVQIARDLASTGAHLVLAARDQGGLEETADLVRAAGGRAEVFACDVSQEERRGALVKAALGLGPIAVLVNNAGIEVPLTLSDQTAADVERQIVVDLLAPIQLTRLVLPHMLSAGRGAVVMISSMSGKTPTPYNSIYSAAKHGLNGFAGSLRIELAGSGVHVGTVCPSFVAEAGMWVDSGTPAPRLMPEVPQESVVRAVRRVIDGSPEELVTPTPVRPMLAIGQLFSGFDRMLLERLGVLAALGERAQALARKRAQDFQEDPP
ncbi:MAG: SDR family NAD(P)-dependent oxidoreductase [Myxococcota bacterium]|nr:SDR family NAD(P)-dependent oxidoreductase [Myxococcota bacterium]